MAKSRNRKGHKKRAQSFKEKQKKQQNELRSKMYNEYIKTQEDALEEQEDQKDVVEEETDIDTDDFTLD